MDIYFVCAYYLFHEVNRFSKAKLKENCELQGTDIIIPHIIYLPLDDIRVYIFKAKNQLLCLFSFKYFFAESYTL